ncbi:MAG: hypothetical protein Q9170_006665 [Blastenia crenularia]
MAFQQPVIAPSRSPPVAPAIKQQGTHALPTQQAQPAESQEWILFPAAPRTSSSYIQTASTAYTPKTAGLSRLSEFGSLNTADRSSPHDGALEDDEDLDSLDDGLHAFHEPQGSIYNDRNGSILPTHDGLGTFPGLSAPVQEHIWRFEQNNPQRRAIGHSRRRSSVQRKLDALEYDDGTRMERERIDRIETWRLEHSRILLEEVERESRRLSNQMDPPTAAALDVVEETSANTHNALSSAPQVTLSAGKRVDGESTEHRGTFWHRIIQSLLQDVIGLDDMVLSLMFGEALPSEDTHSWDDASTSGKKGPNQSLILQSSPTLSLAILNRLSQELVSALRQFSYAPAVVGSPINPISLDYAGIPIAETPVNQASAPSFTQSEKEELEDGRSSTPLFKPTLREFPRSPASEFGHAALWGIEEEATDTSFGAQDNEYWEQTPSIKTIFRLLQQHFIPRRRPLLTASTFSSSKPSNLATTSTADSLRRASVIRQHHPLISRQNKRRTGTSSLLGHQHHRYSNHSTHNGSSPLFKRGEGSCASISSRKSKKGSGSSRNYWDLGASVHSGSVGGIGIWGEV